MRTSVPIHEECIQVSPQYIFEGDINVNRKQKIKQIQSAVKVWMASKKNGDKNHRESNKNTITESQTGDKNFKNANEIDEA